ncbi:hypothetical protein QYE80_32795 [Pseudomonas tohonis]|nr:hypothetical protein [Pseudomonas tohonis]
MKESTPLPHTHCCGAQQELQQDCQCTKCREIDGQACAPNSPASEQQQAILDEEAVRVLLSGGTLVFRVPHPVKGEGV